MLPGVPIVSQWHRGLAATSLHFTFVPPGSLSWEMLDDYAKQNRHRFSLLFTAYFTALLCSSKENVCSELFSADSDKASINRRAPLPNFSGP